MLRLSACETLRAWLLSALVVHGAVAGNPDAKRLYDDLLSNYNKLVRPVVNTSDVLRVCIKLKLSQLIDVLSTKSALSSRSTRYGLEHQKFSDEKLGYTSADSLQKIASGSDASDVDTTRTYTLTKYIPNIYDIQSVLVQNMNDVSREESEAVRMWNESWKKSKLLLDALQSQRLSARRVAELKRSKRRRNKLAQEAENRRIKSIETSEELRRVLEEFKMVKVEDLHRLYGDAPPQKKLIPAYFVLKVSQDSVADLQNLNGTIKNIKLVFANDEKENPRERRKPEAAETGNIPMDSLYRNVEPSPKMKDQILQTCNLSEIGKTAAVQEENRRVPTASSCNLCERVEQDLKCQKEFNVSLLDQMKDVMQQLLTMTDLLRDIVLYKQSQLPDEIGVKRSNVSSVAVQNDETQPFADFSSQTYEEEEIVSKISQNEFTAKDSEMNEVTKSSIERISAATSDIAKLPFGEGYDRIPEQRRPVKRRKKSSLFRLCCVKSNDCDATARDEDCVNEYIRENMSDKATKCEENENIGRHFPRWTEDFNGNLRNQEISIETLNSGVKATNGTRGNSRNLTVTDESGVPFTDNSVSRRLDELCQANRILVGTPKFEENLFYRIRLNEVLYRGHALKIETREADLILNVHQTDRAFKRLREEIFYNAALRCQTACSLDDPSGTIPFGRAATRDHSLLAKKTETPEDVGKRRPRRKRGSQKASVRHPLPESRLTIARESLECSASRNETGEIYCSNGNCIVRIPSSVSVDTNLKNQIMTTNLWVEQSWYDYKLRWDPKEYGGVHMLHVPSDHIWRPDIVLYNNADGNYEVTLMTKARVSHTGLVEWQPPAVYKSSCAIDVEFFPYDIQTCVLKLGSWTYDGFKVDLRHMDEKAGSNVVEVGVDLSEFYMSVEWDILEVPAVRNEKFYTCCDEPYLDITFNITMRRKTLFYTVNIIIPCMGISFLTVLTFYLPSDSGEKVTLSISILISLHVFFLLVVEIIPPTSLVVPLLGKYLIFAMILVSISICVTVVVLNVHFRSPQTHKMAPWVKRVFIHILPRLLVMRRPQYHFEGHRFMSRRVLMQTVRGKEVQTSYYPYPYQTTASSDDEAKVRDTESTITRQRTLSKEDFSQGSLVDGPLFGGSCQIHGPMQSDSEDLSLPGLGGVEVNGNGEDVKSPVLSNPAFSHSLCPPEVHKSCFCVRFIAEHTKMLEDSTKVKEDWKYVAMVLDRLFLWIFTLAVLVGTAGIILQAPTLYDDRIPIDKQFAEIQTSTVVRCPPQ